MLKTLELLKTILAVCYTAYTDNTFIFHFLGCGSLYVADGNWKLKYSHCMWKVPIQIEGFRKAINYPDICPLSPERGKAFCTYHCTIAAQAKIPCGLHEFLKHCGVEKDRSVSETGRICKYGGGNVKFLKGIVNNKRYVFHYIIIDNLSSNFKMPCP